MISTSEVSIACKYESFNALIKINDPDLLLEVFLSQITPDYSGERTVEIYQRIDNSWNRITVDGGSTKDISEQRLSTLEQKIDPEKTNIWFYEPSQQGWFCGYKPLSSKQYAMFVSIGSKEYLIDEDYIQLLFGFYCHQLRSLEGTYRDNLTGLYNRKAFDLRMASLLVNNQYFVRRNNLSNPAIFVMMDIDYFKQVNDNHGHLYGDEILSIIARLMTDSFREYDLLFRYGGEEFAAVLMDIDDEIARQILNRFRLKVKNYAYPKHHALSVSIGYTDFNQKLSVEELIHQADIALYYSKQHGRNVIHKYQDLLADGLISAD